MVRILPHAFVRYSKSIVDNSVIVSDKIISVTNSVSTNETNTISAIVTSVSKF